MITRYLRKIDDLILAEECIVNIEVLRKDIWQTEFEQVGFYRYKIFLQDGSMVEMTERLLEERGQLKVTKYRFHWQNIDGILIKRWDNAPHHHNLDNFPHHLHDGKEDNVISHMKTNGIEVLSLIIKSFRNKTKKL